MCHVQCRTLSEADFPRDGAERVVTTRLASAFKVKRVNAQALYIDPCPDFPWGTTVRSTMELQAILDRR